MKYSKINWISNVELSMLLGLVLGFVNYQINMENQNFITDKSSVIRRAQRSFEIKDEIRGKSDICFGGFVLFIILIWLISVLYS